MVLQWKEREHDQEDTLALANEDCMEALRACRLKKSFLLSYLRAQTELLRYLINLWDEQDQVFRIWDQLMELDVSNVYFITGLSRRGPVPLLTGSRPTGEKMEEVKARVCPEAKYGSGSSKVDIPTVQDLILRALLFTITRAAGAQAQSVSTRRSSIGRQQ